MATRQTLYLSLPIYVRELFSLMINHFQTIMERTDKSITFETYPDSLLAINLTNFYARVYDDNNMKTFWFSYLPPFVDYTVKITGLEFRPENREIYYTFDIDLDFVIAMQASTTAPTSTVRSSLSTTDRPSWKFRKCQENLFSIN